MKIECIVSRLVIVDAPDGASDGLIEVLARNEFYSRVSDLDPERLSVEIVDWGSLVPSAPKD